MRAIALALLVTFPLFAQRYDDTITVNVVDVPVFVEQNGLPVKGLTRDDFALYVDGKPHPIEYFDVVEETPQPEPASAEASKDLRRRRLIVLLFDIVSSPYALQKAREAAIRYVAGAPAGDSIAVATIGRSGIRFVAAFTNDRVAVQRAIGTLAPSAADDPFRVATLESERSFWTENVRGAEAGSGAFRDVWGDELAPGGVRGMSSGSANAYAFQKTAIEMERLQQETMSIAFVENLTALAAPIAPLEGVKEVVLLSDRRLDDSGTGLAPNVVLRRAARLHQQYRKLGVILNAVDTNPPTIPGGDEISTGPDGRAGAEKALASDFLIALANDTGGAVAMSLPLLRARNGRSYVLGFQTRPGVTHGSIRLEVKNLAPLADLRYRKSFDLVAEKAGDKGLFLADTLLNDIPQNGVTLDLSVKGTEVTASIPGLELLAYHSRKPLQLEAFFYVFDEEGRPFSWKTLRVAVDLDKGREFLSANAYTMRQDLELKPGRYVVKALVRVAGTDRFGFDRAELVVAQ